MKPKIEAIPLEMWFYLHASESRRVLSESIAGTLCRIDDLHPESNMQTPVERAEDWRCLY